MKAFLVPARRRYRHYAVCAQDATRHAQEAKSFLPPDPADSCRGPGRACAAKLDNGPGERESTVRRSPNGPLAAVEPRSVMLSKHLRSTRGSSSRSLGWNYEMFLRGISMSDYTPHHHFLNVFDVFSWGLADTVRELDHVERR